MAYTHLLWDYNGTIVDDVQVGIDSLNTLLFRRGMKTIDTIPDYYKIFGFPIIDYYRRAGFDFDKEPFEKVAVEWVTEYEKNFPNAPIREGGIEAFQKIKALGVSQVVLSACESGMLNRQLEGFGIAHYFDSINGIDNIYASSKVAIAQNWADNTAHEGLLFVGDTVHDFEVASAIGADCLLLEGGHQNRETLLKCGCPVISNPLEILEYLQK